MTITQSKQARRWADDASRWVSHHAERLALLGACITVALLSFWTWVAKGTHPTSEDLLPWLMLLGVAMYTKAMSDGVKRNAEVARAHGEHEAQRREAVKLRSEVRGDIRAAHRDCKAHLKADARRLERRLDAIEAAIAELAQAVEQSGNGHARSWFKRPPERKAG